MTKEEKEIQRIKIETHLKLCDILSDMQQGSARREAILECVAMLGRMQVNRNYTNQLKEDRDLRKLIKDKKLIKIRIGMSRSRETYLILP